MKSFKEMAKKIIEKNKYNTYKNGFLEKEVVDMLLSKKNIKIIKKEIDRILFLIDNIDIISVNPKYSSDGVPFLYYLYEGEIGEIYDENGKFLCCY